MINKLILVLVDDWEGLYHNGILIDEGHSIGRRVLINHMKRLNTLDIWFSYLNEEGVDLVNTIGCLPNHFDEILKEHFDLRISDTVKSN